HAASLHTGSKRSSARASSLSRRMFFAEKGVSSTQVDRSKEATKKPTALKQAKKIRSTKASEMESTEPHWATIPTNTLNDIPPIIPSPLGIQNTFPIRFSE